LPENTLEHTPEHEPARRLGPWSRLVRFGFRLLYGEMAWSYDLVAWLVSFGQWRAWGQTALPYLAGERVLELGHGPGHLLLTLTERGFRPVGLDVSPHMGQMARRRLRRAGRTLALVRGRAQALPFPTQHFDSVVATFPTAYIVDPATLAQVARVLRPGGRLVVVVGAQLSGRDPLSRLLEWLYRITGQRETMEDWESPFVAAGLNVRRVQVEVARSQVWLLVAERVTLRDRR
jgi:ubiquinone/menaquinone biosynthesis C-methylase UbiE